MRRLVDELLDLAGCVGGALCKLAHFLRHDGEALAGLTSTCGLDTGIERQKVGLKSNVVNDLDDLFDLARGVFNAAHGVDGIADDRTGAVGALLGNANGLIGLARPFSR